MSLLLPILSLILLFLIGLIIFGLWWFKFRKVNQGNVCVPEQFTTCLENGNTAYIENTYDPTIPPPATSLKIKFFNKTLGYPWCIPTQYAIRYVDGDNYGPLSEWSDQVVATQSSDSGCSSNVPQMELTDSDGILPQYKNINVHRRIIKDGVPQKDEIVGQLLPIINMFIDTNNPNENGDIIKCIGC